MCTQPTHAVWKCWLWSLFSNIAWWLQELYSGGKDCNILAWVPVLRQPGIEDEDAGTAKVRLKALQHSQCSPRDIDQAVGIDSVCHSGLPCWCQCQWVHETSYRLLQFTPPAASFLVTHSKKMSNILTCSPNCPVLPVFVKGQLLHKAKKGTKTHVSKELI